MSVETIVARIAEDATAEASAILAEADVQAGMLVEAARAEARRQTEIALDRAAPGLHAEEVRQVNAARLRLLERRAERSAHRTARVFELAEARLGEIAGGGDRERWSTALRGLAAASLALVGSGASVRTRASDAAWLTDVMAAHGACLEILPGPEVPPGLVARSADGRVEVDATLPARLARARARLAEPVARALGLEG